MLFRIICSLSYSTIVDTFDVNFPQSQWTDCIIDKVLKNIEIVNFIATALKSILKLVKLKSLVAKCCKMQKTKACKICKFCILLYYARGKLTLPSRKPYQFSVRNTKVYKIANFTGSYFSHFTTFRNQTL